MSVRSSSRRVFPPHEIAFIHDAETDTAKKVLFDAVNAGRVRVLLGSTEKMGAGTNVQRRLVALHHLDAPWRPRDIEQREGRILRQGNANKEVQIFRYVTEGSFDAYMWQTLETKARFIQQVMRGETSVRSAEDLESGALTYAEIKAIASGNPAVVEKIKIDTEVRKLDQLRAVHANQQRHIRWEIRDLPRQITEAKQHLAHIEADIATRNGKRIRRVQHDGGQSRFLRQGRAGGSGQGSDVRDPLLARRSNDAAARCLPGLRDIEQREERRIRTASRGRADAGTFRTRTRHVFGKPERGESGWDRPEHRTHIEEFGQARGRAAEPRGPRSRKNLRTTSPRRIALSSTRSG